MPPKCLAAMFLCLGLFAVHADTKEIKKNAIASKKWNIGIMANGFIEGSSGDDLQSSGAGGLRTGYRFDPAWSLVGEFMYTTKSSFRYTDKKTDIYRILADVNWDAWPKDNYTPYITAGLGYESFPDYAAERNGVLAAFGGGIRYIFTESFGINAEAKYKMNLEHRDANILLTFGLNYRFSTDKDYTKK